MTAITAELTEVQNLLFSEIQVGQAGFLTGSIIRVETRCDQETGFRHIIRWDHSAVHITDFAFRKVTLSGHNAIPFDGIEYLEKRGDAYFPSGSFYIPTPGLIPMVEIVELDVQGPSGL